MKKRLSVPVSESFHSTIKICAAHEKLPITLYVQHALAIAVTTTLSNLPVETTRREKAHDA